MLRGPGAKLHDPCGAVSPDPLHPRPWEGGRETLHLQRPGWTPDPFRLSWWMRNNHEGRDVWNTSSARLSVLLLCSLCTNEWCTSCGCMYSVVCLSRSKKRERSVRRCIGNSPDRRLMSLRARSNLSNACSCRHLMQFGRASWENSRSWPNPSHIGQPMATDRLGMSDRSHHQGVSLQPRRSDDHAVHAMALFFGQRHRAASKSPSEPA